MQFDARRLSPLPDNVASKRRFVPVARRRNARFRIKTQACRLKPLSSKTLDLTPIFDADLKLRGRICASFSELDRTDDIYD